MHPITCSTLMDLTGHAALQKGTTLFCHVCIYIEQASFSQPDGGSFFIETINACEVCLQILKSKSACFFYK